VSPIRVIALFGSTGSGKTAAAVAMASRVPAEIVSADSAAVYRGLEILTAAPEPPTRLVGVFDLAHEVSVGEYQVLAHAAIDEILAAGRLPVVVGGTGLYLRAAVSGLSLPPAPEPGVRERWAALYDERGGGEAHALLAARDPAAAARVHPNDRRRIVRALELAEAGASLAPGRDTLWSGETRHETLLAGLELPEETLRRRIEQRTRRMFELGVAEEARRALAGPLAATAAKVLGLREVAELPRPEAEEALLRATLRLARYQRKWMRRLPGLVTVDADRPPEEIADAILALARARERLPADRRS
jgi:tRNA dimethylallyltransferase